MERCFKLHGFPSTWNKDKKSANMVQSIDDLDHISSESQSLDYSAPDSVNTTLSIDQYKQLLTLLSKQSPDYGGDDHPEQ